MLEKFLVFFFTILEIYLITRFKRKINYKLLISDLNYFFLQKNFGLKKCLVGKNINRKPASRRSSFLGFSTR